MLVWFSETIRVFSEGLRQDLERHVPVELGVPCPIHFPHPAYADLGGDGIGAEGGAGCQGHSSGDRHPLEQLLVPVEHKDQARAPVGGLRALNRLKEKPFPIWCDVV